VRLLNLPIKDNPYVIHIGNALLTDSKLLNQYCIGEKLLIVSNTVVAPLYIEKLISTFENKVVHQLIIDDGEVNKSRLSFFTILDYLITNNFRRNDTLLALGGGVIGDLAGFAAASYQRGMSYLQLPTSLLAQVDSSVGGKTAINHPQGKNMIGAFYQPKAVIIDTSTLETLPDREFVSGFGEIIKYALLGETEILTILEHNSEKLIARDPHLLEELIYLSCRKKAQVVAKDEKEQGERALLNLGHTFAHALETLTNYDYYLHGEAVALGILMALKLSVHKKTIEQSKFSRYEVLIKSLNLPTRVVPKLETSEFLKVMAKDKKNQSKAFRLVLVNKQGCMIQEEADEQLLSSIIEAFSD
jgi:3-dehydroquinate synthase